jgi:hypothetical protein
LPNGATAPKNYSLFISITDVNTGQSEEYGPGVVPTILAGASSVEYDIDEEDMPFSSTATLRISFRGLPDNPLNIITPFGTDYMASGYYSANGTVLHSEEATLLPGGQNYTGINMTLIPARVVSGNFYYPNGAVAVEDCYISILANQVDSGSDPLGWEDISIPAGASAAEYTLLIPDDPNISFILSYYTTIGTSVSIGHYASTETTCTETKATHLPGGQDLYGIDLKLPYSRIEGTISLPSGNVAPSGGLDLYIDLLPSSCTLQSSLSIPENSSSVSYSLYHIGTDPVYISYKYNGDEPYVQVGYYSSSGTVAQSCATLLQEGVNHTDIDLTLRVVGITIEGTVSLPSGTAPAGGVDIRIWTRTRDISGPCGSNVDNAAVTIQEGESSAPYSLTIPTTPNAQWRIYYYYSGEEYLDTGYYARQGTTQHYRFREELPGGQFHSGIDLTLLPANTINGTVFLPLDDATAPAGGLDIKVRTSYGADYDIHDITIPEGQSSAPYSLKVIDNPGSRWNIYYSYAGDMYLAEGYYAQGGTTGYPSNATLLLGGQDYIGIDMTVLKGKTIEGTVLLPPGTAPTDGVRLTTRVRSSDQSYSVSTSLITIPEGNSSMPYKFVVPDGISERWIISYNYYGDEYISLGYYAQGGTANFGGDATVLDGGQNYTGIDMTLLKGKTIQGTVSLPSGTAPAGGISVSVAVNSLNGDYEYTSLTTIPEGDSSAIYLVNIPDDITGQWRVSYYYPHYSGNDYLRKGYYAEAGTVWKIQEADLLTGGIDLSGINLTLLDPLPTKTITGKVFLPNGMTAVNGQSVRVMVFNAENSLFLMSNYPFNVGADSITYEVELPQDDSVAWWIGYSLAGFNYPDGFYRANRTTLDFSRATPLSANVNHSGIDMTITDQDVAPSITPILMLLLQ